MYLHSVEAPSCGSCRFVNGVGEFEVSTGAASCWYIFWGVDLLKRAIVFSGLNLTYFYYCPVIVCAKVIISMSYQLYSRIVIRHIAPFGRFMDLVTGYLDRSCGAAPMFCGDEGTVGGPVFGV